MIDWTRSMQQTFEYYEVDPITWRDTKKVTSVITGGTIERDLTVDTLGSASFELSESTGEYYIRVYMIATQDRLSERINLGTFLIQTPSTSYDGMVKTYSITAYTPLIELKENSPELGYYIEKNSNIPIFAKALCSEHMRTPVCDWVDSEKVLNSDYVAETDETWLTYISNLIGTVDYHLAFDEDYKVVFAPDQKLKEMIAVWEYNDSNSSIILPSISIDRDLYGIPNVIEVIYSSGSNYYHEIYENNDPSSPISIQNRGRRIIKREVNPSTLSNPTKEQVAEYAKKLMETMSEIEYTIKYTHGYCPVNIGDCVIFNYESAGLKNVRAKVKTQSISCSAGCQVTETATYTSSLLQSSFINKV